MPKFKMPYFSNSLGKLALIYHDQPVFAGLVQVVPFFSQDYPSGPFQCILHDQVMAEYAQLKLELNWRLSK